MGFVFSSIPFRLQFNPIPIFGFFRGVRILKNPVIFEKSYRERPIFAEGYAFPKIPKILKGQNLKNPVIFEKFHRERSIFGAYLYLHRKFNFTPAMGTNHFMPGLIGLVGNKLGDRDADNGGYLF